MSSSGEQQSVIGMGRLKGLRLQGPSVTGC